MLGFEDWPPWTTPATPKSRKIAARPSPATTAMTPSGMAPAGAAPSAAVPDPFRSGSAAAPAASPSVSVVNAAARVSRTSRAWLSRFSTLIRLSDPCVSPKAMTWSGRSLWTWILSARASPATSTDSPIDSRWTRIASTSSGFAGAAWSRYMVS